MDTATAYIPIDWRHALARGETLPERMTGAALFADISGFTPLTEALARELGPRRGAEELTVHLNRVYDALIAQLHRYGGSVIGFSGDAITCWLDGDNAAARATACALAMQATMTQFAAVRSHSGRVVSLGMKAAVASGSVRRFRVGDPAHRVLDVMAGTTLENLTVAEHLAERGDVVIDAATAAALGDAATVVARRIDAATGQQFAVVSGLQMDVAPSPWPELAGEGLSAETTAAWLLPPVFQRLKRGQGDFLAELRPAVALFLKFSGINYESDRDAPQKLDQFVHQVQRVLVRYSGSLLQLTIGDKGSYLYAAFGAPIAHEDDAVRAASAALTFNELSDEIDYLNELQIGITVGRMRTGAYGSATRRTYGVLGDATNLSARLMSVAQPGQILVSGAAKEATGDMFTWEQLPAVRVKGKREPVAVARLLGLKRQHAAGLTEPRYRLPMVGRQAELAMVSEKLAQVLAGRGQVVGISAEAGMGKSRLAAEVIRLAGERGMIGYGGECQSYGTNSSYLVWQGVWRGAFGLDGSESAESQIDSVAHQLRQIDPLLASRLPLLGPLLNLTIADNELTRSLDAKVRKSSLESLLVAVLQARASAQPLLIVLEDVHWIDPLSADLVTEISRAIANRPVLLLLVYRPPDKKQHQLSGVDQLPYYSEIALTQFSSTEAEQLIALKLGQFLGEGAAVPPAFQQRITEQAAGNPFYIEEILNYLHDLGVDSADSRTLEQVDLPDSLYSLVLSRIDRLSEKQKATLKVASVIGRVFQAAMVWGVYPELGSFKRVRKHLNRLSRLDLTPLDVPEPEFVYLFKHIITQQVAYESLLYRTRTVLHGQIGGYIERENGDHLDQYLDILAHHYGRSDNREKQRVYLLKAGDAAQRTFANAAAIDYFERSLPLLSDREAIDVRLKLGQVYELTGAWDEAAAQFEAALAAAMALDDLDACAWSLTAQGELLRKRNQYVESAECLATAQITFDRIGNQEGVGRTLHILGTLAAQQGNLEVANSRYERSLALRRALGDRENEANLLNNLGIVARYLGDPEAARQFQEASLAIHEEMGNRWSIGAQLNNLGHAAVDRGEYAYARERLEQALLIWQEIGERWATANTIHNLANVAREERRTRRALELYADAASRWLALDDRWGLAYWLEDVALLQVYRASARDALELIAVADRVRETINAPRPPSYAAKLDEQLEPMRSALSIEEQRAVRRSAEALSIADAIDRAMETRK